MIRTEKRTIYVELLEEGTPCWRPVDAEYLGDKLYRIGGEKPEDEVWAFLVGDVVKCKLKAFQDGSSELVAHERKNE
jgi:hypothetical protein